jgi:hypothetical protein
MEKLDEIFGADEILKKVADAAGIELAKDSVWPAVIGTAIGAGLIKLLVKIIPGIIGAALLAKIGLIAGAALAGLGPTAVGDQTGQQTTAEKILKTTRPDLVEGSTEWQTEREKLIRDIQQGEISPDFIMRDIVSSEGFGVTPKDRLEFEENIKNINEEMQDLEQKINDPNVPAVAKNTTLIPRLEFLKEHKSNIIEKRLSVLETAIRAAEDAGVSYDNPELQKLIKEQQPLNIKLQNLRGVGMEIRSLSLEPTSNIERGSLTPVLSNLQSSTDNIGKIFSFTPILDKVSQSAMNTANIIFAPTNVAPVTSISNGGSSVASVTNNSVTSFGGNGGGIGLGKFAV